jgi:outer membrane protein assembly factor BamD
MLKFKFNIYFLFIALLASSCSEYQKVLNKGTVADQYKMASELYDAQKYNKAIQLFEKITPSYRGKPQMERIQYMVAQSHYNTKQYSLSAYYFDKFVKNYPKSSKVEEAAYLSAHSYYLASPVHSLDQKDTEEAIAALQNFIFTFGESDKVEEANSNIKDLTFKLEKKAYEVAYGYYHRQNYVSAIVAFDNLLSEYLGTSLREDALYYKFKSAYELGMNSIVQKKEERIKDALKFYERLQRNYPESDYHKESTGLIEDLNNELNTLIAYKNQLNGL